MKRQTFFNGGFSLLDLFILFVIIGILASVALPAYNSNMKKAKAYEAEVTLKTIQSLLNSYYEENGKFPVVEKFTCVCLIPELEIDPMELDGKNYHSTDYIYRSTDDGQKYILKAIVSNEKESSLNREIRQDGVVLACSVI
ncbi:MAG: type IV pilin protein [Candidatus Zhuqueibacterota bacterium]